MALRYLLSILVALSLLAVPAGARQAVEEPVAAFDQDYDPEATTLDGLDEGAITTAFRRMKRAENTQWELRTDLPEAREPSRFGQAISEFIGAVIEFLIPVFKVIFWAGVAALGLILLYAIYQSVRTAVLNRREEEDDVAVPEYRPSAGMARILLEEADALAAEGRYAEAIHVLLYRSIQDIDKARPDAVRLSLTSREIAASPALDERTRRTFSALARIVERSHFAERPVGAADYMEARALYESFATPQREVLPSLMDGATA